MIQRATVGIGIEGKEGNAACKASDFSVEEFQDLARMILVHGRQNYITNDLLALFFKS